MDLVNQPMHPGAEDDCHDRDEDETAEQRVQCREQLGDGTAEMINRAHPTENHRRVEERVDPGQSAERVVSQRSKGIDAGDQRGSRERMTQRALDERSPMQERLCGTLVHRYGWLQARGSSVPSTSSARAARCPSSTSTFESS